MQGLKQFPAFLAVGLALTGAAPRISAQTSSDSNSSPAYLTYYPPYSTSSAMSSKAQVPAAVQADPAPQGDPSSPQPAFQNDGSAWQLRFLGKGTATLDSDDGDSISLKDNFTEAYITPQGGATLHVKGGKVFYVEQDAKTKKNKDVRLDDQAMETRIVAMMQDLAQRARREGKLDDAGFSNALRAAKWGDRGEAQEAVYAGYYGYGIGYGRPFWVGDVTQFRLPNRGSSPAVSSGTHGPAPTNGGGSHGGGGKK